MLECVVNISEGRDLDVIQALQRSCASCLLDTHIDPFHNRAVFTLLARPEHTLEAAQLLTLAAIERIDMRAHHGVHPRIGAVDVVPFIPYAIDGVRTSWTTAIEVRDRFATWIGEQGIPAFLYGPERSLPQVRKWAFHSLIPDAGPESTHIRSGSCAVGVRNILVAYNINLIDSNKVRACEIAKEIRSADVRALGLLVGDITQVSCNLIAPESVGPEAVYDQVAQYATIGSAELVGLLPNKILHQQSRSRWKELDLDEERTIEARLAHLDPLPHSSSPNATD